MPSPRPFRRPVSLASMDNMRSELDPAAQAELAHMTAQILVTRGRENDDPEVTHRLVNLADEMGLEVIAEMWANSPAVSLPGALWRLYVLRRWVQNAPHDVADQFHSGMTGDEVSVVLAGVATPPGPDEVKALADQVLGGVYTGDFSIALQRAAAFCRVVALGRTHLADEGERASGERSQNESTGAEPTVTAPDDAPEAELTRSAGILVSTAEALERSAAAWRQSTLD
ncbi:hypothetical protein LWF01_01625 [Saxibacter everestensis]|uniref:Uncharacterized protein n=1 Tax=Saxibacter everestensis TaxID=2909229 RepID=A0ABY8QU76_9MICO|nr:hypothetical protein LWF01_01625 [Brevibacteriaceae bacterium ZFBP1038]